jgi:urease accessory protein
MKNRLLTLFLLFVPLASQAHTGWGSVSGFWAGFLHPLCGWDHVVAMLAVGIWGVQLGGKRIWLLPLAFVSVMTASALLAMIGMPAVYTESGIIASDLALALLILGAVRFSTPLSVLAVALFAVFHGAAHGSEAPLDAAGFDYIAGFASTTALLHLTGITVGLLLGNTRFVRGGWLSFSRT